MKGLANLFKKKNSTQAHTEIVGISAAEYECIHDALEREYEEARDRQKEGTVKPSRYMEGIMYALDLLEAHHPHTLEG